MPKYRSATNWSTASSGRPPLLQVSQAAIDDLRSRLRPTRWPTRWPVEPWAAGTDASVLKRLVDYWANGYDWRVWEAAINELPSRYADIGGHQVPLSEVRRRDACSYPDRPH